MKEKLLHFIWENRKLPWRGLRTTEGECIQVHHPGQYNTNAGPDFLHASISIGPLRWTGPVEIHLKASDWYGHGHEQDPNYTNVILHLVWEDDQPVCLSSGTPLPTVELRQFVDPGFLNHCNKLLEQGWTRFIPCEGFDKPGREFALRAWWEDLYDQRLEYKADMVLELHRELKGDWDAVLFRLLAANFGARVNKQAFASMAASIPFRVVRKLQGQPTDMEALFLGMAGLLERQGPQDRYKRALYTRFRYLRRKYRLNPLTASRPDFFRLRPLNFPTIRLSQLASLYSQRPHLFSAVLHAGDVTSLYKIFDIAALDYWSDHYVFGKQGPRKTRRLASGFKDLLLLNTVFPLRLAHARKQGRKPGEMLSALASDLPPENNQVVTGFINSGIPPGNALESQAQLQLFEHFCARTRCLECAIGKRILIEL